VRIIQLVYTERFWRTRRDSGGTEAAETRIFLGNFFDELRRKVPVGK